jgi:hypothetical protein
VVDRCFLRLRRSASLLKAPQHIACSSDKRCKETLTNRSEPATSASVGKEGEEEEEEEAEGAGGTMPARSHATSSTAASSHRLPITPSAARASLNRTYASWLRNTTPKPTSVAKAWKG